jgi:HlyD family secretion protein
LNQISHLTVLNLNMNKQHFPIRAQAGAVNPVVIIGVAVLALAGAAYYFMQGTDRGASTSASEASAVVPATVAASGGKPALTVNLVQSTLSNLPVALAANGNVAAWQEASVGADTNGLRLAQVLVNVGDSVKKGQLLATFAADGLRADVAQAKAGLAEAQAHLVDAVANAERAAALKGTGALSVQQIEQFQTAAKAAEARVQSSQAMVDAQSVRLSNAQVVAPDSGVISARNASVGAVVGAGMELFRLIRQSRLEWRGEVTSAELARVKVGGKVTVITAGGNKLDGRVRAIAPTVDPQTRASLVYVDLPGGTQLAKAGMFARGEFDLGATSATTVPQTALVVRDGFSYLYRVNADNRVTQLKVQTGRIVGDKVEVLTPLDAKAKWVATGAGFLNDGDLVRVLGAPAPTKSASSAQ